MGYDSSKFNLVAQGIAANQRWEYTDTGGETAAGYMAAGFFTDAKNRGVDTGDFVTIHNKATNDVFTGWMNIVQDTGATTGTFKRDTGVA